MKKRTISLLSLALLGAMVIPGAAFAEEGSVLNVEVWNEEFKSRITDPMTTLIRTIWTPYCRAMLMPQRMRRLISSWWKQTMLSSMSMRMQT